METQTETAKKKTKKDVHAIFTEQVIEKLKNGIVPWRVSWITAGVPENLISGHEYRSINRILLASLGYARNLFLTSKQLKEADGAILPYEKPHVLAYLSDPGKVAEKENKGIETTEGAKQLELVSYTVFNIAQCKWSPDRIFPEITTELDPLQICVPIKAKDQKRSYYDPLLDFINLPKEDTFLNKERYCYAQFHQLMHSTGHYSRLNRKDLIQMSEFGYDPFSQEELVAEIGASYLMSHHGMRLDLEITEEYLAGWIQKFEYDKYLIFSAANQAEKAISFLFLGETGYVQ